MASDTAPLRIAQITDTHLFADPAGTLLGLDTRECLQRVVELARRRRPEAVIATGDLTHDASPEAYARLCECLCALQAPVYCLPGNHDESATLKSQLDTAPCFSLPEVQLRGWQLAFIDSTVVGEEGGHIAHGELRQLDEVLGRTPGRPAIVCLHHQPVAVGSRWMDGMAVDNPDEFFRIIDRHPQVRAILWGHVHQQFEHRRNGVALLASPSTCIQFLPRSEDFALDDLAPGYRWLELHADGHVTTGVERIAEIPGRPDPGARGY